MHTLDSRLRRFALPALAALVTLAAGCGGGGSANHLDAFWMLGVEAQLHLQRDTLMTRPARFKVRRSAPVLQAEPTAPAGRGATWSSAGWRRW